MAPSLQNMPEGTGLFDLAPSQDETKDGFHNSMVLVSCVVVLMSLLPGLVVVISKVDVLPSVRRSVMTCARPCLTLGSVVVCAAAMAAALLYTIVFSFPDCVWYGGLALLFVFTRYLVWFGCSSRMFPGLFEGKFKGKDKSCEVPQSSVGFRIIPVQVPAGVGILGAAAAICYEFVLVDAFGAAASELLYVVLIAASAAAAIWNGAVTALCIALSAAAFITVLTLVRAFVIWKVSAAFCYVTALVGAFLLASAVAYAFVEVWQQTAAARGCHTAFWAKATPRVDVGDTPNTMLTASPRCGLWLGNLDKVGKEEEGEKEKYEEKEEVPLVRTLCSSCPVFLRTLSGRTVVMIVADCSTSELLQRIEEVMRVPQQHWYCHVNGSPLPHSSAPHGLQRDCTVVMCARLKGGAPTIPGEWFCQVCQRGGCWPARTHCFRCCCKKGEKTFRGPPRERQALGRAPPAQGTASCPTERRPAGGSLPITNFLNRLYWRL